MVLTEIATLDALLNAHTAQLGDDFTAYRNHTYRVANLCVAHGTRTSYTEADFRPSAIGDGPCVADSVRCAGDRDRAHGPFVSDVTLLRGLDRIIDLTRLVRTSVVFHVRSRTSSSAMMVTSRQLMSRKGPID